MSDVDDWVTERDQLLAVIERLTQPTTTSVDGPGQIARAKAEVDRLQRKIDGAKADNA